MGNPGLTEWFVSQDGNASALMERQRAPRGVTHEYEKGVFSIIDLLL